MTNAQADRMQRGVLVLLILGLLFTLVIFTDVEVTALKPAVPYPFGTAESGIFGVETPGGYGTGVLIRSRGNTSILLTANHVVGQRSSALVQGQPYTVLASDRLLDVTLLQGPRIDGRVWLFSASVPQVLEPVWALGLYPPPPADSLVTEGVITGSNQLHLFANPGVQSGMSGGILINSHNEIVGLTSSVAWWGPGQPNSSVGQFIRGDRIQAWVTQQLK